MRRRELTELLVHRVAGCWETPSQCGRTVIASSTEPVEDLFHHDAFAVTHVLAEKSEVAAAAHAGKEQMVAMAMLLITEEAGGLKSRCRRYRPLNVRG